MRALYLAAVLAALTAGSPAAQEAMPNCQKLVPQQCLHNAADANRVGAGSLPLPPSPRQAACGAAMTEYRACLTWVAENCAHVTQRNGRSFCQREQPAAAPAPAITPPAPALPAGACREERLLGLERAQNKRLQEALFTLGYRFGQRDGVFGPLTRQAIRDWQTANGAAATGCLTEPQVNALTRLQTAAEDQARLERLQRQNATLDQLRQQNEQSQEEWRRRRQAESQASFEQWRRDVERRQQDWRAETRRLSPGAPW